MELYLNSLPLDKRKLAVYYVKTFSSIRLLWNIKAQLLDLV